MRLIIVSGLSGSGKTVALHVLEDLGYYCIDNLPATLIKAAIDEARRGDTVLVGPGRYTWSAQGTGGDLAVLLADGVDHVGGGQVARAIAKRLAGERGTRVVKLAGATVRSVALGILGVALIQTFLASLGFLIVGVPGAGLWALLVLILAVVQLPTILILGPIIVYVFSTSSTVIAVVFAIWSILVGISDAFLKPLLMGRGVDVPMLVIFIGAIGGFMTSGIIGLFVGAIIFALGYKLFLAWLNEDTQPERESSDSE